jgi:DNA primase
MNVLSVEALKQMNLAEFLACHYGLEFQQRGATYQCCSPFTDEKRPSFFVRLVGGHWLFQDFSSRRGGSIFDFVQMKENLPGFAEALAFVRQLVGASPCVMKQTAAGGESSSSERSYDVNELYDRFRREDPAVCRDYLLGRAIAPERVEALIEEGLLVHNRYQGCSYCCFAVRDAEGQLKCLDNHAIEGSEKFVLGAKHPFSCEWEEVRRGKEVFLTEGIIDYLSMKSLELAPVPGLALLGNQLCFDAALLEQSQTLISAMDDDPGGDSAVLDLQQRYPEKAVRVYDLDGHKDPNELLVSVRRGEGRTLTAEMKVRLYREFQQARNKTELARRWGIDRKHLYQIAWECEQMLVEGFSGRRRGRPAKGRPATLDEALARIEELESAYERKATEEEKQYCRSEFLAIRLKWAEREAAELRGEAVDEEQAPKKRQIKKKRKTRRWKK